MIMKNIEDFDKMLDKALATPPAYEYPSHLAMKVSRKILLRKLTNDRRIQQVQYMAIGGFSLVTLLLMVIIIGPDDLSKWATGLKFFATAAMVYFIFQVLERKLASLSNN